MPSILPKPQPAPERASLADVCGKPAKADLHPHLPAPLLREVAATAIERTDIQKEIADQIGIHRSRLTHKLKDGSLTLRQLEELGPEFFVILGQELLETFGPLATPQARARQVIRAIRAALDELDQFTELIA